MGTLRNIVNDAEQLLDGVDVPRFISDRRQIIHPGHIGDGLRPRPVFKVLLNAGMQVANSASCFCDRLTLEFEDQTQNAMR